MTKLLLTGASGFLGTVITKSLIGNYQVVSLGRTNGSDIICDLSKEVPQLPADITAVVHGAGLAHQNKITPQLQQRIFGVNVTGTANLLDALSQLPQKPKSLVYISSVSVYGVEAGLLVTEDHPLLGESAYAKSKIAAEQMVKSWGETNQVKVCILRLPLIVGPQPKGNLQKMIAAMRGNYYFRIGAASARKSMVWAQDVAEILPMAFNHSGTFTLTDGQHPKMSELEHALMGMVNKKRVLKIPSWVIGLAAKFGDLLGPWFPINSSRYEKLTTSLTFDDTRAREKLGWKPHSVLSMLKTHPF